jgi:hypothetical protein
MSDEEMSAEEAYQVALNTAMTTSTPREQVGLPDRLIARNILEAELGRFADPQPEYNLDEATRNRLIAHGREDAVHVLMVALRLTSELKELKRLVWTLVVLFVVFLVLTFWPMRKAFFGSVSEALHEAWPYTSSNFDDRFRAK